jgi:tetratricopeptide (TPR) repeat protein
MDMGFGDLFKKDKTETRNELLSKGLELLDSGKNEKAMKCFDKAIPLLPEFAGTVWNFKGITFTRLENAEEAMKCFDKAIPLLPEFAGTVWNFKGITFTRLENAEEAMKCFDKAIELSSDPYPAPWIGKATMFGILGNTEEAIKYLDKVIKMTDDYPDCRYGGATGYDEGTVDMQAPARSITPLLYHASACISTVPSSYPVAPPYLQSG